MPETLSLRIIQRFNIIAFRIEKHDGYIFPLSPKYLLFIGSGNLPINIVDMRYADRNTVAYFNQAISRNKVQTVISRCRDLS